MRLNSIKPADGATFSRRRVGRGMGSGFGKTAGRGHKGQKSRAGGFHKVGFEGGQMPLQMRLPKRGFNNINRVEYVPINLSRLQAIAEKYNLDTISLETLVANGIVKKTDKVKILGRGELTAKLTVNIHASSEAAKKAVESTGGSLTIV